MHIASASALVISLDFELLWGVRDKKTIAEYGANILGARQAIPRLLDLFEQREIACTWATVGFLFCADKDELVGSFPTLRPNYREQRLSPYEDLADLGRDENDDPYRYGLSLLQQVAARRRQEIGTHTFSHFYCLEGGGLGPFRADLAAAHAVAARRGIKLVSIAFPRNQVSEPHLRICCELGLKAFRGNERVWFQAPQSNEAQSLLTRGFRLADSYLPIAGAQVHFPALMSGGLVDVPSSRFLRPVGGPSRLERLRLRRITAAMARAAQQGRIFHLWWHPHNFGVNTAENMGVLAEILDQFGELNHRYGMRSMTMAGVAAEALHESA